MGRCPSSAGRPGVSSRLLRWRRMGRRTAFVVESLNDAILTRVTTTGASAAAVAAAAAKRSPEVVTRGASPRCARVREESVLLGHRRAWDTVVVNCTPPPETQQLLQRPSQQPRLQQPRRRQQQEQPKETNRFSVVTEESSVSDHSLSNRQTGTAKPLARKRPIVRAKHALRSRPKVILDTKKHHNVAPYRTRWTPAVVDSLQGTTTTTEITTKAVQSFALPKRHRIATQFYNPTITETDALPAPSPRSSACDAIGQQKQQQHAEKRSRSSTVFYRPTDYTASSLSATSSSRSASSHEQKVEQQDKEVDDQHQLNPVARVRQRTVVSSSQPDSSCSDEALLNMARPKRFRTATAFYKPSILHQHTDEIWQHTKTTSISSSTQNTTSRIGVNRKRKHDFETINSCSEEAIATVHPKRRCVASNNPEIDLALPTTNNNRQQSQKRMSHVIDAILNSRTSLPRRSLRVHTNSCVGVNATVAAAEMTFNDVTAATNIQNRLRPAAVLPLELVGGLNKLTSKQPTENEYNHISSGKLSHGLLLKEYSKLASLGQCEKVTFGKSLACAHSVVDQKIEVLEKICDDEVEDLEILADSREYKRSLRSFSAFEDQEKLASISEEEDYVDFVDIKTRRGNGKDTSKLFRLTNRPIIFSKSQRVSCRNTACSEGSNCGICGKHTEKQSHSSTYYALTPWVCPFDIDAEDDADLEEVSDGVSPPRRFTRHRNSVVQERVDKGIAKATLMALTELKHSISFIEEYNADSKRFSTS